MRTVILVVLMSVLVNLPSTAATSKSDLAEALAPTLLASFKSNTFSHEKFTSDGKYFVYKARLKGDSVDSIYSTEISTGKTFNLTAKSKFLMDSISAGFAITPASDRVIWTGWRDKNKGSSSTLYSSEINRQGSPVSQFTDENLDPTAGPTFLLFEGGSAIFDVEKDNYHALYRVITNKNTKKISHRLPENVSIKQTLISEDSGQIFYTVNTEVVSGFSRYSNEIHRAKAGGKNYKLLVSGGKIEDVRIAAGRLVYRLGTEGSNETNLFSVGMNGGEPVQVNQKLIDGYSITDDYVVSKNGKYVYFAAPLAPEGGNALYRARVDGEGDHLRLNPELPENTAIDYKIDLNNKSGKILYTLIHFDGDKKDYSKHLVGTDGSAPIELLNKDIGGWMTLKHNPDIPLFLWWGDFNQRENYQLYNTPATGGKPVTLNLPLKNGEYVENKLAVASTGRVLAYTVSNENNSDQNDLYVASADGAYASKIADGQKVHSYWMSPDGGTLLYIKEASLTSPEQLFSVKLDNFLDGS